MKKVFVSHVSEDNQRIGNMKDWVKETISEKIIIIDLCQNDHRDKGNKYIEDLIDIEINNSDCVVLLIGRDTHSKPWIDYEIKSSKKYKKPIIPIRLPNETGSAPESIKDLEEIDFNKKAFLEKLINHKILAK